MDGQQGAGPGPLLLQLVRLPGGLGEDPPLGDEDDVLPAELLLELSHQPSHQNVNTTDQIRNIFLSRKCACTTLNSHSF